MKQSLTLTAIFEAATGLVLIIAPSNQTEKYETRNKLAAK